MMIRRFKQVVSSSTNSLDLAYRSISVVRRKQQATSPSRYGLHCRGRRASGGGVETTVREASLEKSPPFAPAQARRCSSQSQDVRAIAMSAMPDIDYGSRLRAGVLIPSGNSV